MAIQDGQRVRAQESNAAWASKTVDNTMVGIQNLQNPSSGADVNNVQQEINDIKQDVAVNTNDISNLDTVKQDLIEKGQANGYASLDALGKVPLSEIPDEIVGGMKFQGLWDASTNTPTLADGVGDPGDVYQANVAGTVDFGSGNIVFTVGDFAIYSGTVWQKIEGGLVESVNGNVGVVVLDTDDIAEGATNEYYTDAKADARADARIAAASIDDLSDVDLTIPPVDGQALVFQSGSWVAGEAAGGSGEGRVNFIENGNFETDAADWVESDDTKLSIGFSSSSPLVGAGSGLITKLAVDASGAIVSKVSRAIDIAYRGKPLFVEVKYDLSHANYVSGDLILQVFDSTNAALLNVFPIANLDEDAGLLKGAATALAICYPPDTCAEVVFRTTVVTDNATASTWNGKIDDVLVGPDSPTPTLEFKSQVVTANGDFTGGTLLVTKVGNQVTVTALTDLTHASASAVDSSNGLIPDWARPSVLVANVYFNNGTEIRRFLINSDGRVSAGYFNYSGTLTNLTASGVIASVSYAIQNTSGNLMSSFEASLSAIKVLGVGNAGDSITALTTDIPFIEDTDNFSTWNGTTFTAPKDMYVLVQGCIASTVGVVTRVLAYVNTVQTRTLGVSGSETEHPFTGVVYLTRGQTLTIRTAAMTLSNSAVDHWISITEWVPPFSVFGAYSDGSNADVQLVLDTGNGHGSTNTAIRRFTNAQKNTLGAYATYADSGTAGMSVTINIPGIYSVSYTDHGVGSAQTFGVSKNSAALTTSIVTLNYAQGKMAEASAPTDGASQIGITERFLVGDVIRAHTNTSINGAGVRTIFRLTRIGS